MSNKPGAERSTYFVKAMQEGLAAAMREDSKVVVIGEDVDRSVIGATRGLQAEFGEERVRNTPISEQAFVGAAVGAAAVGMDRPLVWKAHL
jgi:pyruvate dehydrogenase E1 component beta subunit